MVILLLLVDISIKVGSVMESEEERGVAHMIEHLAFRASRTCPQEFDLVKEVRMEGGGGDCLLSIARVAQCSSHLLSRMVLVFEAPPVGAIP